MGTNFYIKADKCPTCGRSDEQIHLGKSSFGWKFTLQANGFTQYKNWEEMKEWLKDKKIVDEYDREISLSDFIEWVENRQSITDPADLSNDRRMHIIDGYKFYDCDFS